MEVTGVVLGGIPIALYVLDNYKRCLRAAKDIKNYQRKLEVFRLHVFVQNEQLQVTLQNIGLHTIDDQLPTKADLKEHLESLYPADKCDKFIGILSEMEEIVKKLLDKLDVDTQGKPKWTREAPDRVCWEWRRVRRGLNTSARDELVHELQYWNTALSKVFEKPEIPQNEDGPLVQRIQGQFNAKMCNATRKNVSCTYVALAQAWKYKSARSGPLTLTVSTNGGSWASLTSEVEHDPTTVSQASPKPISLAPPSLPNSQKRKKVFFWSKDQTPVETQTSSGRLA
ncbi:hypothetical protein CDV36_011974 [Fusarium kuroshium]|uniref:Uncharacterized protein n=1 Tax=Fusarium kuroshium TaxID=2010991 RepID=A0A3M2RSW2_9HYPO|nr:hypothetical protein CDV36_011974 [Fusarium kuroshium]